jgi:hypothetical protein
MVVSLGLSATTSAIAETESNMNLRQQSHSKETREICLWRENLKASGGLKVMQGNGCGKTVSASIRVVPSFKRVIQKTSGVGSVRLTPRFTRCPPNKALSSTKQQSKVDLKANGGEFQSIIPQSKIMNAHSFTLNNETIGGWFELWPGQK